MEQNLHRVQKFLADNHCQGNHAIIAIDEAQTIDDRRTFEALRMLLNFEVDGRPTFTLLLVGQTGLLPAIERMPGLEERLGVKCLLRPLTIDETASYVSHRLQSAGAKRALFEQNAWETLFDLTQGFPRRINRLCDLALLIGFAEERSGISSEQLEAVHHELVHIAAD